MKMLMFVLGTLLSLQVSAADPHWLKGVTSERHSIQVWRSESCGCCKAWIDHLKAHQFDVVDTVVSDLNAIKDQYAIAPNARSCHTAKVGDLLVEGHVPAQDIKRALAGDTPELLTVPGMPSGGPGMDSPGARRDAFTVFAVDQGQVSEFARHENY
ncbi:MAG: DUF411 domain-containing protein [Litorivicinus sp.]